jgi:hypothetical protein
MLFRRGRDVIVRDLGSRHGTAVRGLALAGDVTVGDGLELRLARSVSIVVKPATEIAGAVSIELGTSRYVAPLGPARVGVGRWRLEPTADDWVELVTDDDPPAYAGTYRWVPRATLLRGDSIASERGGAPCIAFGS